MAEPNWIEIEKEYRAGQMSISAICARFVIDRVRLNDYVAKYGWTRNLQTAVRAATQEAVLQRTAGPEAGGEHVDMIDKAGARAADVVMGHRDEIIKMRAIADRLTSRLVMLLADEAEADGEGKFDINPLDVRLLGKTDGTISAFNRLVEIRAKLILMERQAYDLDDGGKDINADTIQATIEAAKAELRNRGASVKLAGQPTSGIGPSGRGTGGHRGSSSVN